MGRKNATNEVLLKANKQKDAREKTREEEKVSYVDTSRNIAVRRHFYSLIWQLQAS